jgi:all-trans-8'-apo-beta-carotenal 15,15'-oxygenase
LTCLKKSAPTHRWSELFSRPPAGFKPTLLKITSGSLPEGLRGSLYHNGPARLRRGDQHVGHWIDGDGAILGLHFTDDGVSGVYQYVKTDGYQAEEKSGKLIFGGYGTLASGGLLNRLFSPLMKNPANTSVLPLPNKLLALWEGGPPHAVNLETLDTYGIDTLGALDRNSFFSAHPKCDPQTGEIYNFGLGYGRKGSLNIYHSSSDGRILRRATIDLDYQPYFHDFILTEKYLIFFVPPLRMNPLPLLARLRSFSDSLAWSPSEGTRIIVVDRQTLNVVSYGETEPWFQWHFGNGYVDANGDVVADVIRYDDFRINQYFKEIVTGRTQTAAESALYKLRLNPQTGKLVETHKVLNASCEFPVVAPDRVGRQWDRTYFLMHQSKTDVGQKIWNTIGCFDYQTGKVTQTRMGEDCYPMEPVYAPDSKSPRQNWILTVVFDGSLRRSEVWVFDADRIHEDPICKIELPEPIPTGFHGVWRPIPLALG